MASARGDATREPTTADLLLDVLSGQGFREGMILFAHLHAQGQVHLDAPTGPSTAAVLPFEEALWQRLEQGACGPHHLPHAVATLTGLDDKAFDFGSSQWLRVWKALRKWLTQDPETTQAWDWTALDSWASRAIGAMPDAAFDVPEARGALIATLRLRLPCSLSALTVRRPDFWQLCAGEGAALFAEARQAHAWTMFVESGNNPCARIAGLPLWRRVMPEGARRPLSTHGFAQAVHDWLLEAVAQPERTVAEREEVHAFLIDGARAFLQEDWSKTDWETRLAPLPVDWLLAPVSLGQGPAMPAWLAPFFADSGQDANAWADLVVERPAWRQIVGPTFDLARCLLAHRVHPDAAWPAVDTLDETLIDGALHPDTPALIETLAEAWPMLTSASGQRMRRGTRTRATAQKVRTYADEARRHFTGRMLDGSMPPGGTASRTLRM